MEHVSSNLTEIKFMYTLCNLALILLYAGGLRLALLLASLSPEWLAGLIAFLYFLFGILGGFGFFYFGYLTVKKFETILTTLAHTEPSLQKLQHTLENWYLVNILIFILSTVAIVFFFGGADLLNLIPEGI